MDNRSPQLNATNGSKVSSSPVLIFGCGYLGRRVARLAVARGDKVFGSTRSERRAAELADEGVRPVIADWTDARSLRDLPQVDRVLVAVSYDRGSRRSRYDSQVGGFRNLLATVPPEVDLCYISTTGVYHQKDGSWVDETSPARPNREGGRAHLQAEQLLHRLRPRSPWTVMRLAGIYGPDRVPRAADVIAGRPIASPASGYLNLIHVEDAASAVLQYWDQRTLSAASPGEVADANRPEKPSRLYLVGDDRPVIRGDFYREIARQCRAPEPVFTTPDPNNPSSARSESNKRIWNRRLKRELLPRLMYPSYRYGLAAILAEDAS